jgi:hypothetical protein
MTFMVEEWHYSEYSHLNLIDVMDQLEVVVDLERGKSLVAWVRKRTVPKIPGSPIVRGKSMAYSECPSRPLSSANNL